MEIKSLNISKKKTLFMSIVDSLISSVSSLTLTNKKKLVDQLNFTCSKNDTPTVSLSAKKLKFI